MSDNRIFTKFLWTAAGFGASSGIRFALSVAMSRLLSPGILGVMVVLNSVRLGIELLSDVGIEQNIIHHPDGLDEPFRDTAWSMQVLRGLLLSAVFLCAAPLLSRLYGIDVRIFLVAAVSPLLGGLHSVAVFALVKRLEVSRRNLFELSSEALAFVITVVLAVVLRTVWAPVFGLLAAVAVRSALSYRLPGPRARFRIDPAIRRRILHFGKWIALTSLIAYAASNLDRLVLGRMVPLGLLGIYGIARAIAELPTTLARRISYQIIFPALAGGRSSGAMAAIGRSRLAFVLPVCAGLGLAVGIADELIHVVYDHRYAQAGWMLAVLLCGGIFAILSNLNEALLLAAGRPGFSTAANLARLVTLALGMVAGFAVAGFAGTVVAVALTELCQYLYMAVGLVRVKLGFWRQDAGALALAALVVAMVIAARHALALGDPFHGMAASVVGRIAT